MSRSPDNPKTKIAKGVRALSISVCWGVLCVLSFIYVFNSNYREIGYDMVVIINIENDTGWWD